MSKTSNNKISHQVGGGADQRIAETLVGGEIVGEEEAVEEEAGAVAEVDEDSRGRLWYLGTAAGAEQERLWLRCGGTSDGQFGPRRLGLGKRSLLETNENLK